MQGVDKMLSDALAEHNALKLEEFKIKDALKMSQVRMDTLLAVQTAQKIENTCSFAEFRKNRVRVDRDTENKVSTSDLWRSYRYWCEATVWQGKKLTRAQLLTSFENEFGKPVRPLYQELPVFSGVHVFNTDEEVAEFDKEKAL